MRIDMVFEHAMISLVGLLVGVIVGIPLGYGISRLVKRFYSSNDRFRELSLFLPWRTMLAASLLIFLFPVIVVIKFGLGLISGIVSVGVVVFLLTIVITVDALLLHQRVGDEKVRIVSALRTLSVLSIVLTTHFGIFGGGGLGFIAFQSIRLLKYNVAITSLFWMVFLALVLDLVFGLVQLSLIRRTRHSDISEGTKAA